MSKQDYDWNQIMDDQQTSGLSIKAYCRQHSIHPATFHYHKKRRIKEKVEPLFLPLSVHHTSLSDTISIRINSTIIEVPSSFLPTIIQQLK